MQFARANLGQQLNAQLLPASLEGMQKRMGTAKGWDKGTVSEGREGRGNKFCKGNCHLPEAQPPIQFSWWAWNRASLGQFWPAVPTVFSPSFLLIPGLVAGAGRVGGKWNLDAVQAMLSKSQSTGVSGALLPQIQSKAAKGCYEESYLSPSRSQYSKKAVFF